MKARSLITVTKLEIHATDSDDSSDFEDAEQGSKTSDSQSIGLGTSPRSSAFNLMSDRSMFMS